MLKEGCRKPVLGVSVYLRVLVRALRPAKTEGTVSHRQDKNAKEVGTHRQCQGTCVLRDSLFQHLYGTKSRRQCPKLQAAVEEQLCSYPGPSNYDSPASSTSLFLICRKDSVREATVEEQLNSKTIRPAMKAQLHLPPLDLSQCPRLKKQLLKNNM